MLNKETKKNEKKNDYFDKLNKRTANEIERLDIKILEIFIKITW